MTDHPICPELAARIKMRGQSIQALRFEAAYPDVSDTDREALDAARGVLIRLNQRDQKRLDQLKESLS